VGKHGKWEMAMGSLMTSGYRVADKNWDSSLDAAASFSSTHGRHGDVGNMRVWN
jgi:hypothetical protein